MQRMGMGAMQKHRRIRRQQQLQHHFNDCPASTRHCRNLSGPVRTGHHLPVVTASELVLGQGRMGCRRSGVL